MFTIKKVLLFCILFLGLFLRLIGTNWDQGWHLHPDERFLTMVGVDIQIPPTAAQYLDPHSSTFNPVNKGNAFFVYGTFPLLINKIVAHYFSHDSYDTFNLQGRVLSGVFDFLIILIAYRIGELVEKKLKLDDSIKYLAAFFYAIAVLPIQLSHFFTVDTFLNFFCWLSFYFSVKLVINKKKGIFLNIALSAIFLGLAIACKLSAFYFAPLIGIFVMFGLLSCNASLDPRRSHSERSEESSEWNEQKKRILFPFFGMTIFLIFCYLALRVGSPYYFETNNIINPQISTAFINSISTLKSFENPSSLFPPGVQWLTKTPDFLIKNIIFFGVGPLYFLLSIIGAYIVFKRKNIYLLVSLLWIIVFLIYQSFQFVKTMRYLIFIYPFLALFAAIGLAYSLSRIKKISNRFKYLTISSFICLAVVVWPLAFMSIYTKDHSRVTASKWIYKHIPANSSITYEYWDDPLPLPLQDPLSRNYKGIQINIFDPDTKGKWETINKQLKQADYYIMSSNRGWGSIGNAPERYPISSKFYKSIFEGKNSFTFVKEFTSYPSLRYLGIPLDFSDRWAEEAFTVYDHPQVLIYKIEKTNNIN